MGSAAAPGAWTDEAPPCLLVEASGGKIRRANKACAALTGYASDELVDRPVSVLFGPNTCAETVAALARAMAAGTPLHVLLLTYAKTAQPFLTSISVLPIPKADGALALSAPTTD